MKRSGYAPTGGRYSRLGERAVYEVSAARPSGMPEKGTAMLLRMSVALVLVLCSRSAAAQQQEHTVLDLTRDCRPALGAEIPNNVGTGFCAGVFYMVEGLARIVDEAGRPLVRACLPSPIRTLDLVNAFVRWSDTNPQQSHQPAMIGAITAIVTTYPCGRR
jgi:hypothetical protein